MYLVRKRNVNGGVFGFVRYCKVKDAEKLLKAVNNVWFSDRKVVAKVASFDKNGKSQKEGKNMVEGEKRKHEGEIFNEAEKISGRGLLRMVVVLTWMS